MSVSLVARIESILPQTQCRECGYEGCKPYAQALAQGGAAVNLCAPGGNEVMLDIAALLERPAKVPEKNQPKALAWIDEAACIGCTACIRACPVDAIMGAAKQMHTVIATECTGCGLCVAPCPVDCIDMQPVDADYLPQAGYSAQTLEPRFAAAAHAKARYEWHQARKIRDAAERKAYLAEKEAHAKARMSNKSVESAVPAAPKATFNPADLIAQAMARAQVQQTRRVVPSNREAFKEQQIKEAQEKAAYRRALRDVKYGDEETKNAAIEYLRAHKAAQEAKMQDAQQG
ncbi:MAG: RnfABCDGE type electron transport complex subunit B [Neisseria sp.]|uniref:RnfABCDGE type electron transport complex subunit B n=1 Tax=Neisseria sp. TaxID=192066 RepID=UPI0026DBCA35|nr:RnfABCDGE type electron transport complex subunit B [Neisseria sp.]MDO4641552.1 RnfABCDGE type electron transport complex subunit B [Neisseria sp.]